MLLSARKKIFARWMLGCLALMFVAVTEVPGQGPARSFEVSGVVLDPSGAVIADAKVILRRDGGRSAETKTANQRGEFHFTRICAHRFWTALPL